VCRPLLKSEELGIKGFTGTLPGFDSAILVYMEVRESSIHVQPNDGDNFIPFSDFRAQVAAKKIKIPILDPMREGNC
jgi:hypothetical protein